MTPRPSARQIRLRFQTLITQPDVEPPLDELCLLICRLAGYDIDVAEELARLDRSAASMTRDFDGVLNALFRGPDALRGNTEAYYDPANSMISEVRRRGLGLPITLSVMAIEHARRIGVGIRGVGMPGHFIVASVDRPGVFADPFDGGRVFGREGAIELFHRVAGADAPWHDAYLRPVSTHEIVFRILNNVRVACIKNELWSRHLSWVLELQSWFPQGAPFGPAAAQRAAAFFN